MRVTRQQRIKRKNRNARRGLLRAIFEIRFSNFLSRLGARSALALAAASLIPRAAYAQGCALCYTSAAAAHKAGIQALRHGILILLIPPLLMFLAIVWLTYRRRGELANPEAPRDAGWDSAQRGPEAELSGCRSSEPVLSNLADLHTIKATSPHVTFRSDRRGSRPTHVQRGTL